MNFRISGKKTLDKALAISFCVHNIKDAKELRKYGARELAVLDYFYSQGGQVSAQEDPLNFFSTVYLTTQRPNDEIPDLRNNLEKLSEIAFFNCLNNDFSRRIYKKAVSRDDKKKTAFLDSLIDCLSEERKQKVFSNEGIEESVRSAALLYIIQKIIPDLSEQRDLVLEYRNSLCNQGLVRLLRDYKKMTEINIPEIDFKVDEEASEIIRERDDLIEECSYVLVEKIRKRKANYARRFEIFEANLEEIDRKDSLSERDLRIFKKIKNSFSSADNFYQVSEILDEEKIPDRFKEIERKALGILKEFEEFEVRKSSINENIRKIGFLDAEETRELMKIYESTLRQTQVDNRYVFNMAHEIENKLNMYLSAARREIQKRINGISSEVQVLESEFSNPGRMKFVKNIFTSVKIRRLSKRKNDLESKLSLILQHQDLKDSQWSR